MKTKLSSIQKFLLYFGLLIVFNLFFTLIGGWNKIYLVGVLIDFGFIVLIAQELSLIVRAKDQKIYEKVLAIGFPILVMIAWELTVKAGILNPRWFPPPTKIAKALWELITGYDTFTKTSLLGRPWLIPEVWREKGWEGVQKLFGESHLTATLFRVISGFLVGSIPGIIVGVIMGMSRPVRTMLNSMMSAIYVLPKVTIFPIMMLVFADPFGEPPKIAVIAIAAFFQTAINTMAGVADVENVYLEAGRNYGANAIQMFRHVILPGSLPFIFAGLRLAIGTALNVIVAIEFVRAKTGLGYLVLYYWEIMVTEKMYASLLLVMILGAILSGLVEKIQEWVMPWQRGRVNN
jgi:NitT/TauT family transport system permease protein